MLRVFVLLLSCFVRRLAERPANVWYLLTNFFGLELEVA